MEKSEFNEWLQRHQKAYPALADWFASLPDQKGTLAIWFDALRWLDKAHADEATSRMMRGVEPLVKYTNWHDTPRFISDHAECLKRESRPKRRFTLPAVDGEPTFRCRECFDTGVIDVFHGHDVRLVRKGRFDGATLHRSARACQCDTAKRYRGMTERGDLPIYNVCEDVRVPMDRAACTHRTVEQDIECILGGCVSGPVSLDDWAAAK